MGQVALLSLVTESVASTLCETALFAGLRDWVKARSAWLGKLACCGYCLGHWVAIGFVAMYRPRLFEAWWLLDYALTALVIAWLAALRGGREAYTGPGRVPGRSAFVKPLKREIEEEPPTDIRGIPSDAVIAWVCRQAGLCAAVLRGGGRPVPAA